MALGGEPSPNLDLLFPEGKTGRYVKVGWNNYFNEILMNTHLAYMSKRAYVFQPYQWNLTHYPWPPRGSWHEGDNAPRSVSDAWFEVVGPLEERKIINTTDKLLLDAPESCIEIVPAPYEVDNFPQVFDIWLCRIVSLWAFSKSPTSRLLETSPIIESAVARNRYLFLPRGPRTPRPAPREPYERMLAMHIRRDYKQTCHAFASFGSSYYSWYLPPFLLDVFTPLDGTHSGRIEKAMEHKVRDARSDYLYAFKGHHQTLDVLYLLTNEHDEWLDELKNALRKDSWTTIATNHELELDLEQLDVSMAMAMDTARRAAVFIGNGWSSFTSNIVHRLLVDGKLPVSTCFYYHYYQYKTDGIHGGEGMISSMSMRYARLGLAKSKEERGLHVTTRNAMNAQTQ
ncbi:hypothetical protein B0H10DRAFT_2163803 [Mycena sp. CBHHK59/15]|nr:hypothetical protein B0H10DRAFT_2163803 [Mycena sp. CBHHK59/15]